MADESNFYIIF